MANKQLEITAINNIYEQSLEDVMHNSMMPYSEYVILDRALPRVEDGLKPVQRRILYAMHELGVTSDKPHRKCARIVGDCLGKYHPHGDRSIYDALVRMAQPFNMNMILVDGHGNFGSVDGDSAAAMRYTEARMSSLSDELLRDLDKDTVKWSYNFDDSLKEPDMLPGRFPNLLVNGASGIAVGLATNIPPHNLVETINGTIALIDSPKMDLKALMEHIPAPDFPTGGYIIATDELIKAYQDGKGKIFLRAKVHIENADNDKKNIVITELPYQVNKADLLQRINDLREQKKDSVLSGINDIVDESDRKGMRAVIKVKKDTDTLALIEYLYNRTDLQISFNFNMVAIADGRPKQLGLIEILKYYIEYQRTVILKRSQYDLNVAKDRAEIVEGFIIAILNIDEVIKIIKKSSTISEAKTTLKQRFELSEKQVNAIMEMRLSRLVQLETVKLQEELKELKLTIEKLKAIIGSKKLQYEVVKDELKEIKKKYKIARRSIIVNQDDLKKINIDENVENYKEGIVVVNNNSHIRLVTERSYNTVIKANDITSPNDLLKQAFKFNSKMQVFAFTNLGNCCKLTFNEDYEYRKWKDKGDKINFFCSDCATNEKVVKIFAYENDPQGELFIYTKDGYVKKSNWSEYIVNKDFYQAINLKDKDEVINVENVKEKSTIFFTTIDAMCLNAEADDVPCQGRKSGGVIGIQLNDKDKVLSAYQVEDDGEILVMTNKGYAKKLFLNTFDVSKRYRKGIKLYDFSEKHGTQLTYSDYCKESYDIGVIYGENNVRIVNSDDISVESKASKGKLVTPEKNVDILYAFKHDKIS